MVVQTTVDGWPAQEPRLRRAAAITMLDEQPGLRQQRAGLRHVFIQPQRYGQPEGAQ